MHAHGDGASGGVLVAAMWSYAASVLYPAQALKRAGLVREETFGDPPQGLPRRGLGPFFSPKLEKGPPVDPAKT